jgi:hypothetical protein
VRDGNLFLRGRPKLPAWTRLNATAPEGATEIVVQGSVNWDIGADCGSPAGPQQRSACTFKRAGGSALRAVCST